MSRRTGSLRDMDRPTIADLEWHRKKVERTLVEMHELADDCRDRMVIVVGAAVVVLVLNLVLAAVLVTR